MVEQKTSSSDLKFITDIAKGVVEKLGIKNYNVTGTNNKYRLAFSITNVGQSTDQNWSTFPVIIELKPEFAKIYIVFTYNGKAYSFVDPSMQSIILYFITLVNSHLKIGMLKYTHAKCYVRYENCFSYRSLDKSCWFNLVYNYIANALSTYKAFGFGIVKIVDRNGGIDVKELEYLYEICYSRFSGKPIAGKRKKNDRRARVDNMDIDEVSISVEIPIKNINKIYELGIESYFDMDNLIKTVDGRFFYNTFKLNTMDFLLENKVKLEFSMCKKLIDCFSVLFGHGIVFSRLPTSLVKLVLSENNLISLKLSFKCLENHVSTTKSLSDYKIFMWKQLTEFNLSIYSARACPEKDSIFFDSLTPENFAEKNLESKNLLIGSGGFGVVYSNKYCGIDVAIKFPSQYKEDVFFGNERIKKEYLMTKALRHPYIIPVYGCIVFDNKLGYVMKHCEKLTLSQAIKEKIDLPYIQKIEYLTKISLSLNYIHYKDYAHLDIKPHNIFLYKTKPILADFGLSTNLSDLKAQGMKLGCTVYYSPPEQIKNFLPQKSSDIWAFGMTMYQFLLGQHPFAFLRDYRKIEKESFYKLLKEDKIRPKIPEEFEQEHPFEAKIMKKCWKLDPKKRPTIEKIYSNLIFLKKLYYE